MTRLAALIGVTPHQLAMGFMLLGLLALFVLRRPILRALQIIATALFVLVFWGVVIGGGVLIHKHYGPQPAAGFAVVMVAWLVWAGRARPGGVGGGNDDDDHGFAADEARRQQEARMREAERIRQVHEDIRRRNPW